VLVVPVVLAGLAVIYRQVFFDLNQNIDREIANNFAKPMQASIGKVQTGIDSMRDSLYDLSNRESHVEGRLEEMSKSLEKVFDKELHHAAMLSPPAFKADLPRINAMIQFVSDQGLTIEPNLTTALRHKMAVVPETKTVTFWIAAATLINFSSHSNSQSLYPNLCGVFGVNTVTNSIVKNCDQVLDGMSFRDVTFHHSSIHYYGAKVQLQNVRFIDCTFELRIKEIPPPAGQHLTRTLLASNLSEVKIE
jgi:hypothetical protein